MRSSSRRSTTRFWPGRPPDESSRFRDALSHTRALFGVSLSGNGAGGGFPDVLARTSNCGRAMRIAVCAPQVPFERGGAEIFADDLVQELRAREHEVDLVTIPYKWYPGERVLSQAFLWRLLDLEEANGRPIELAIATKFPSYAVRHPNKVVWLIHQFRQAYDLDRTALGQFGETTEERAARRAVQQLDRVALGEARKVFATSRNVAERLERSTGLVAELMPHPPQELPYRTDGYEDFVLSVGRLDRAKRNDLLLEALVADSSLRCVIVGDGPDRGRLEEVARRPLRPLPRRLLRARGRGFRDGSVRGVPVREAGRDDDGCRRAARGGRRPANRAGLRASGRGPRTGVLVAPRPRRRGEGVGAGRQGARAPRLLGRHDRPAPRVSSLTFLTPRRRCEAGGDSATGHGPGEHRAVSAASPPRSPAPPGGSGGRSGT